MQCERCGQRPATVFQTFIVNGHKQEHQLCEECAREHGAFEGFTPPGFSFPNLSIQQLLASFLGQESFGGSAQVMPPQVEPQCKNCGMTYSQFANSGRLGCAQCYDYLDAQMVPLIKRIQGTTVHTGKAPKRTGGLARKRQDLEGLKRQLQAAIRNENYEEAARVRDAIKNMESQIQAGGAGDAVE
ncbi:MAG TPA: UvrB/UvrC motif-containing protein [Symbiobacteriaceae bacterium]|jgi:protein arginine kinase activator